jgi:hypothetical protein
MRFDEFAECLHVAVFDPVHPGKIPRRRIGRGIGGKAGVIHLGHGAQKNQSMTGIARTAGAGPRFISHFKNRERNGI